MYPVAAKRLDTLRAGTTSQDLFTCLQPKSIARSYFRTFTQLICFFARVRQSKHFERSLFIETARQSEAWNAVSTAIADLQDLMTMQIDEADEVSGDNDCSDDDGYADSEGARQRQLEEVDRELRAQEQVIDGHIIGYLKFERSRPLSLAFCSPALSSAFP